MFISLAAAFLVSAGVTPLLIFWARRRNLLDIPNARSSHVIATPRIGGSGFVLALLTGLAVYHAGAGGPDRAVLTVLAAACGMGLLGLADDVRPLSVSLRLVVQFAIATMLVLYSGGMGLPGVIPQWFAAGLTVVWLVAVTNAYNFMDGIDGIAGGQAVVAGLGWAAVASVNGVPGLLVLGCLVAAAVAGFLVHNWPPARVFMGDAGSAFLGLLFSAAPLAASTPAPHFALCAALMLWPFLFDTAFTLLRRRRRGEDLFRAHRSHLYQRLVLTGVSHGAVSALYVGLASVGVAAALAVSAGQRQAQFIALGAVAALAVALWWLVVSRESTRTDSSSPPRAA